MGVLISTTILVGLYVIGVLIFDGVDSNMFDMPLPLGAVIGGALIFSFTAFGPDLGGAPPPPARREPDPPLPNRPRHKPAADRRADAVMGEAIVGRPWLAEPPPEDPWPGEYLIMFLAPKQGAPEMTEHQRADVTRAVREIADGMSGPSTEAYVILPQDWPTDPVAGAHVFEDAKEWIALSPILAELLAKQGLPEEAIETFLIAPLMTQDHGPIVSAYTIFPKLEETLPAPEPEPEPEPRKDIRTMVVGFMVHPKGSVAAAAAAVADADPAGLAQRLRTELAVPDTAPVKIYTAGDWAHPAVADATAIHDRATLTAIRDAAIDRLAADGVDREWAEFALHDGAFETLHFPGTGRILMFRDLTAEAHLLGLSGRGLPPETTTDQPEAERIIILHIGPLTERPGMPDTINFDADILETIAGRAREVTGAPDARILMFHPDEWAAQALDHAEQAAAGGEYAELIASDARYSLNMGGATGAVLDQYEADRLRAFDDEAAGVYVLFCTADATQESLGHQWEDLTASPVPTGRSFTRPKPTPTQPETDTGFYSRTAFICDICGERYPSQQMIGVDAGIVRARTEEGYVPANLPASLHAMAESAEHLAQAWRLLTVTNETDWGICPNCADELDRFAHGEDAP